MNNTSGVYIPQYTPLSAGGAYYLGEPDIITPQKAIKFNGSGDILNTLFESDGLTVTQAGLYLINFRAQVSSKSSILLKMFAGEQSIPGGEFNTPTISAALVKRLVPSSKISVINASSSDISVLRAYITIVQISEYLVSGFKYSDEIPVCD